MNAEYQKRQARLSREKSLMMGDIARPGFQLIMQKLKELSDDALMQYDGARTLEDVKRIQAYRDVVETVIPKVMETILNYEEPTEEKWTFTGWLKSTRECVSDYICHGWLDRARQLFAGPSLTEKGRE